MAYKIHIKNLDIDLEALQDDCLLDVLQSGGIRIRSDCNKYGVCGQCVVRIVEGRTDTPDSWENSLLIRKDLDNTHRLSCRVKVRSDLVIEVPEYSLMAVSGILTAEHPREIQIAPAVRKRFFPADTLGNNVQTLEAFLSDSFGVAMNLTRSAAESFVKNEKGFTAVVRNNDILALEPSDTASRLYGLAVDIGTTTVALNLYNLKNGRKMETASAHNGQIRFGADVVSRLTYAFQNQEGLEKLHREIVLTLNGLISTLCVNLGITGNDIYETVIAGNTAMNHLFLKQPIDTLAVSPFTPHFLTFPDVTAGQTGLCINDNAYSVIVPNIEGFVGGDITAGCIAVDILNMKGNVLFIDLGTNGEIVLKSSGRLLVTSTAAGPAFEGANITHGMMAAPGAVSSVECLKPVIFKTIDDEEPRGICGTGLIDLMALGLETGILDDQGNIPGDSINLGRGIRLFIKDIRQIQMALAAIKSGIKLMLIETGLTLGDLDTVMIAGAFGAFLHVAHAQRIGLLPPVQPERIQFAGNASLTGAGHLLVSKEERTKVRAVLEASTHFHLGGNPDFENCFIEALSFNTGSFYRDMEER